MRAADWIHSASAAFSCRGFTLPCLHMHAVRLCGRGFNSSAASQDGSELPRWESQGSWATWVCIQTCVSAGTPTEPLGAAWRPRCLFNAYNQINSTPGALEKPKKNWILTGRNLEQDEAHRHDILLGKGGGGEGEIGQGRRTERRERTVRASSPCSKEQFRKRYGLCLAILALCWLGFAAGAKQHMISCSLCQH